MKVLNYKKEALKSPQSLKELRDVLEDSNPIFKRLANERRRAEARVDHLRVALKRTRVQKHIDQTVLAEKMGTTQSGISAFERGSGDLGIVTMIRYLEGLSVDPARWLEENARELAD